MLWNVMLLYININLIGCVMLHNDYVIFLYPKFIWMILRWTLSNILHFLLVTFHAIHGNKTDLNTTTHFAKVDAVALNSQPHTIPTSTNQNQDQKSFIATYVTHTGMWQIPVCVCVHFLNLIFIVMKIRLKNVQISTLKHAFPPWKHIWTLNRFVCVDVLCRWKWLNLVLLIDLVCVPRAVHETMRGNWSMRTETETETGGKQQMIHPVRFTDCRLLWLRKVLTIK